MKKRLLEILVVAMALALAPATAMAKVNPDMPVPIGVSASANSSGSGSLSWVIANSYIYPVTSRIEYRERQNGGTWGAWSLWSASFGVVPAGSNAAFEFILSFFNPDPAIERQFRVRTEYQVYFNGYPLKLHYSYWAQSNVFTTGPPIG